MDRDQKIQSIRPKLDLKNINTKPIEKFQNETLRPILKLQHDLTQFILINHQNYESIRNSNPEEKQFQEALKKFIQSNTEFKNQLIGAVIGQFMNSELEFYFVQRKEINKRIIQIQINRYCDSLKYPE